MYKENVFTIFGITQSMLIKDSRVALDHDDSPSSIAVEKLKHIIGMLSPHRSHGFIYDPFRSSYMPPTQFMYLVDGKDKEREFKKITNDNKIVIVTGIRESEMCEVPNDIDDNDRDVIMNNSHVGTCVRKINISGKTLQKHVVTDEDTETVIRDVLLAVIDSNDDLSKLGIDKINLVDYILSEYDKVRKVAEKTAVTYGITYLSINVLMSIPFKKRVFDYMVKNGNDKIKSIAYTENRDAAVILNMPNIVIELYHHIHPKNMIVIRGNDDGKGGIYGDIDFRSLEYMGKLTTREEGIRITGVWLSAAENTRIKFLKPKTGNSAYDAGCMHGPLEEMETFINALSLIADGKKKVIIEIKYNAGYGSFSADIDYNVIATFNF